MNSAPPDFRRLLELSTDQNRLHIALEDAAENDNYRLYEAAGCRWLSDAHNAIQTAVLLADPGYPLLINHRAMLLAELYTPGARSVLDLGAGGGAFCRYFLQRPSPPRVDAVEREARMIALAHSQFLLPAEQPLVHCSALDFLTGSSRRYDLVFCDLFVGRSAPAELLEAGFYRLLADHLAAAGTLALNTLPASERELQALLTAVRQVFAGIVLLQFTALGNIVLLLRRDPLTHPDALTAGFVESPFARDAELHASVRGMFRI